MQTHDFLPVTRQDIEKRGWNELDFLYICGDGYVDHPSFGHAIITRVLESKGYKIGIISQPDWTNINDFKKLGRPRLAVLVSSGNLDSMVNHYTANKKPRSQDVYSPGGEANKRPDRAVIVYCNCVRQAFKGIPIIIGGIEASLRRFAHYDYWSDKVRRSILFDSKADILIYGMGEKQVIEIADLLNKGININDINNIPGTAYITNNINNIDKNKSIIIPSYEEITKNKKQFANACKVENEEQDPIRGKIIIQPHGDRYLVQNTPMLPLNSNELDKVYSLPYMRTYHPIYESKGGIPAIKEVKFSITSCRGCYGACTFCALTFHQGRIVTSRSQESIVKEAKELTLDPEFKGYIHDVGGPTANFREPACKKQLKQGTCKNRQCLYPTPCKNLKISHKEYGQLLKKVRNIKGVKKVFIRSGIRFDYLINDKDDSFFWELCKHHVSGQLKVAPEHVSPNVLNYMGKPSHEVYERFVDKFKSINTKIGKDQYIIPYFIASHPGCTLKDAVKLAEYLNAIKHNPKQVQDFYPTPGTIATCMYYTEIDPRTMKNVYVPRSFKERAMQRALLQFRNPANYKLVYEALIKIGRKDLIGYSPKCLIRPKKNHKHEFAKTKNRKNRKRKFKRR